MSETAMTPAEAADYVETDTNWRALNEYAVSRQSALRVLINHARATAAPGDLAALAKTVRYVRNRLCDEELIDEHDAELLLDVRIKLDCHRCPPAPEIAERPVEIVTPDLDDPDTRMRLFNHLQLLRDGINGHDRGVYADVVAYLAKGAPEPVAPPKVGDTVETAAQLDALPDHTALRGPGDRLLEKDRITDSEVLWEAGSEVALDPHVHLPARIVDLPGGDS